MGRDVIKIPATFTLTSQVTGFHQVANDSLGLTLGYVERTSNIAQARARVLGDQEKSIAMIGE
jgi:hypothetical protein